MRNPFVSAAPAVEAAARPTLELSGPVLAQAMEALVTDSEAEGGVERYVEALKLKTVLFQEALGENGTVGLDVERFKTLCAFMSPVRRRIAARLEGNGFTTIREAVAELLEGAVDTGTADTRISAFCARFPNDREHRWVRDLAAELLHYSDLERYPLMCRWVWDNRTNTGILREIWYGDDVDHMVIDVSDDYATFLTLREELSQFLTDNGIFRDVLFYVDLLCAQLYAGYICSQGGSFLRAGFSAPDDPMQYVRRMLGLDGVNARTGRSRLKVIDGTAKVLADDARLLN